MDKLERFKAAARECARPVKAKPQRRLWPTLPWWVALWLPLMGTPYRARALYWWLRVTGRF